MCARYDARLLPCLAVALSFLSCSRSPQIYDIPPVLANREEIADSLSDVQAGVDAVVVLVVRVEATGEVSDVKVAVGSGDRYLDNWAVWAGGLMRFEPAQYQGRAIPTLVQIPVTFEDAPPPIYPPTLQNADSLAELMASQHGDVLGTAHVRVLVNSGGLIEEVRHLRASTVEVREAAWALTGRLEFTPGREGSTPIAAWIVVLFEFNGALSEVSVVPPEQPG